MTENTNRMSEVQFEVLASIIWMILLSVPLAYTTIICQLTINQVEMVAIVLNLIMKLSSSQKATEIVTVMNETIIGKNMDEMMQIDVS